MAALPDGDNGSGVTQQTVQSSRPHSPCARGRMAISLLSVTGNLELLPAQPHEETKPLWNSAICYKAAPGALGGAKP